MVCICPRTLTHDWLRKSRKEYGADISNYFELLTMFGALFLCASILSIPASISYYQGGRDEIGSGINGTGSGNFLLSISVANTYTTYSSYNPTEDPPAFVFWVCFISQSLCLIFFIASFLSYIYKVRLRETNACIDSMRVQRRSLMILPPEDSKSLVCPYVQEIEKKQSLDEATHAMYYEFFSQYAKLDKVSPVFDTRELQKKVEIFQNARTHYADTHRPTSSFEHTKAFRNRSLTHKLKTLSPIRSEIMECVSQSQSAPRLLAVFVTCKSAGERDKIMKVFETIYCCQTPPTDIYTVKHTPRLSGQRLIVTSSYNPADNVIWGRLAYQHTFTAPVTLLLVMFAALSVLALIYIIHWQMEVVSRHSESVFLFQIVVATFTFFINLIMAFLIGGPLASLAKHQTQRNKDLWLLCTTVLAQTLLQGWMILFSSDHLAVLHSPAAISRRQIFWRSVAEQAIIMGWSDAFVGTGGRAILALLKQCLGVNQSPCLKSLSFHRNSKFQYLFSPAYRYAVVWKVIILSLVFAPLTSSMLVLACLFCFTSYWVDRLSFQYFSPLRPLISEFGKDKDHNVSLTRRIPHRPCLANSSLSIYFFFFALYAHSVLAINAFLFSTEHYFIDEAVGDGTVFKAVEDPGPGYDFGLQAHIFVTFVSFICLAALIVKKFVKSFRCECCCCTSFVELCTCVPHELRDLNPERRMKGVNLTCCRKFRSRLSLCCTRYNCLPLGISIDAVDKSKHNQSANAANGYQQLPDFKIEMSTNERRTNHAKQGDSTSRKAKGRVERKDSEFRTRLRFKRRYEQQSVCLDLDAGSSGFNPITVEDCVRALDSNY